MKRREFIRTAAGVATASLIPIPGWSETANPARPGGKAKITGVDIVKYQGPQKSGEFLEIASDAGPVGRFGPLGWDVPKRFPEFQAKLRELLVGKDPLDRALEFEAFWDALFPGKPLKAFADGFDPLTGKKIWETTRGAKQRHTPTGVTIITLSNLDNALWDLRGKLLGKPVHQLIGTANRKQIPVYTRIGEGTDLVLARKQAREAFDQGHLHQKWYFVHAPSDGQKGLTANMELVRVLREELPDAVLMFDNHSMRFEIGPDWVVTLAKEMLPYKPFWLEEPTAPEDVEGYARIKGETGITVAGGEHHYTRWQIKPLLDRKALDWVQADPDWTGGISEWLRICDLARQYPGVKVVPHSDNILTDSQCVASQSEALCPWLEYNKEQTISKLAFRTKFFGAEVEMLTMPDDPGTGPDLDSEKCRRI